MFKDMSVQLPDELHHLLQAPIFFEGLEMPQHYADPKHVDWFQIGYRVHGITHEDLTSTESGAFQPTWYVFAQNEMADPFFIDIAEQEQGFPVYFARHGQGFWQAEPIAESFTAFTNYLNQIKQREQCIPELLAFVQNIASDSEFWCSVEYYYEELLASVEEDDAFLPVNDQVNPADWEVVQVRLLALGARKLEVVKFIKDYLQLSLVQALAVTKELPLTVKQGARRFMQVLADDLQALGAEVDLLAITNEGLLEAP